MWVRAPPSAPDSAAPAAREAPHVDPEPRDPRHVFSRRAASYTTSPSHDDPEVLARLVAFADPKPDWVALDVATGTGHTALAVAPHVARVVGLDLTPEMLAEARALAARRGVANATFEIGDAHRLPYADASFELVTCRRAAHHFRDVSRALAEMARVLVPGGRLVLDDRTVPDDPRADALLNELDRLHDPSHVREYGREEWRALLVRAGLRPVAWHPYEKLRPLTAFTAHADPGDAARIRELVRGLDDGLRRVLGVREKDGETWTLHFYLMVAAEKPASPAPSAGGRPQRSSAGG